MIEPTTHNSVPAVDRGALKAKVAGDHRLQRAIVRQLLNIDGAWHEARARGTTPLDTDPGSVIVASDVQSERDGPSPMRRAARKLTSGGQCRSCRQLHFRPRASCLPPFAMERKLSCRASDQLVRRART
jgi:hypothetical protein